MKRYLKKFPGNVLAILLMFVFAFVIHSCRRDILRPNDSVVAKTLTNHGIDISKLQKAYQQGINSGKLKVTDLSNQAVANIISTLNVDWSSYTLQEFPDSSKIIEFPMPDDTTLVAPRDSIQNGHNKYRSKTNAVFVLHRDTIILNFFMKTVEDQNDPNYQSVISQQHYLDIPGGFDGEILYFTLDRQFINGYLWKNGSITNSVSLSSTVTPPSPQAQSYKGKLKVDELQVSNCTTDVYEIVQITTVTVGNNPPYTTVEPTGQTFTVTTCDVTYTAASPTGGGVSGGGGTTPPSPPCNTGSGALVSSVKQGHLVINVTTGGGSGTSPSPTPQPCPSNPPANTPPPAKQQATIDKLMKNTAALTAAQKAQVQAVLDQILKDCIGQATYNYLTTHNDKFDFQINSGMSPQASYNPTNDMIAIKNTSTVSSQALEEEFFHAYQNKTTSGGTAKYAGTTGAANIEFEAKVLRDMDALVNGQSGSGMAVNGVEYSTFLKDVTSNFSALPKSFTLSQLSEYFTLMKQFIQDNPGYSTNQIDPTLNPGAMFSLINSSSCSATN